MDPKPDFSDEDLGLMLQGLGRKLEDGHVNQAEASLRLVNLLTRMNGVTTYEGRVKSQGRVSFGRPNEGAVGTAVFVEDPPE